LKNLQIYEIIPIELFVDMKKLYKIIEVTHIMMLENFVPTNVDLQINLKGENFDWGE
jgi:hypothetical protein